MMVLLDIGTKTKQNIILYNYTLSRGGGSNQYQTRMPKCGNFDLAKGTTTLVLSGQGGRSNMRDHPQFTKNKYNII